MVLTYLGINVGYILLFALASLRKVKDVEVTQVHDKTNRIAILIPAYKEDQVIVNSAKEALRQRYADNKFEVFILADQLRSKTIEALNHTKVNVIEIELAQSSKVGALNQSLQHIDDFDIAVILDADNLMDHDLLNIVNGYFNAGYQAIQGQRIAKNTDSKIAFLDSISEKMNNLIFRRGHVNLGLPSALIGSGMAFELNILKAYLSQIDVLGGFDKVLEVMLLKDRVNICYAEDAKVLDEKVSDKTNFTTQRTRWIAAQWRYGFQYLFDATAHLLRYGNIGYFDKVLQFLLLPRLMLLGFLGCSVLVSLLSSAIETLPLVILSGLYGFALLLVIPQKDSLQLAKCLGVVPTLFWRMVIASLQFRKAGKSFLHTEHHVN